MKLVRFGYLIAVFFFPVILAVLSAGNTQAQSQDLQLVKLRVSGDFDRVRIVAVFSGRPDYDVMLLARPARLVINLPRTEFPVKRETVLPDSFVQDVRYGMISAGRSRMIFSMSAPFRMESISAEPLQEQIWQMTADLVKTSDSVFEEMLSRQKMQKSRNPASKELSDSQLQDRSFRIVIDAGHGAFDHGASGVGGVQEKEVTLAFAQVLRDYLQREPGIEVCLTRDDDIFLRLRERVDIARRYKADLFISIHADSINIGSLRGATVYTLSNKASDVFAGALAEHENRADLLDGLPPDKQPEVADILADLTRHETHAFSAHFADLVIDTLKNAGVRLINKPHRYAGFQVLRAPDIPSVLIELGYLSNVEDEKLISDPRWREKMAGLIARSVRTYADLHRHKTIR